MVNGSKVVIDQVGSAVNASLNESSQQATTILGNLSWQAFWLLVILILAVTLVILAVVLRPKKQTKASSPYLKAFVITALYVVFFIVVENLYGPDFIPDWLLIASSAVLFFALISFFRSDDKLFQERITKTFISFIKSHLRSHFDSEFNVGEASGSRIPQIKVLPNTEYGGSDDSVAHYLAFTNKNRYVHYAFGLKSGILLEADEFPRPEKTEKIFKRRIKYQQDSGSSLSVPQNTIMRLNGNDNDSTAATPA